MSNKITNRLSKRMEHELDKLDINEKKNPIRVTKGIMKPEEYLKRII